MSYYSPSSVTSLEGGVRTELLWQRVLRGHSINILETNSLKRMSDNGQWIAAEDYRSRFNAYNIISAWNRGKRTEQEMKAALASIEIVDPEMHSETAAWVETPIPRQMQPTYGAEIIEIDMLGIKQADPPDGMETMNLWPPQLNMSTTLCKTIAKLPARAMVMFEVTQLDADGVNHYKHRQIRHLRKFATDQGYALFILYNGTRRFETYLLADHFYYHFDQLISWLDRFMTSEIALRDQEISRRDEEISHLKQGRASPSAVPAAMVWVRELCRDDSGNLHPLDEDPFMATPTVDNIAGLADAIAAKRGITLRFALKIYKLNAAAEWEKIKPGLLLEPNVEDTAYGFVVPN